MKSIQEIMAELDISGELTSEKTAAIKDAIQAILQSRQTGGGKSRSGGSGGTISMEIDPDLLQPSIKNTSVTNDDIDIEDPEDILSQIKTNDQNNNENNNFDEEDFDDKPVLNDPSNQSGQSGKKNDVDVRDVTKARTISLGKQTLNKIEETPENKSKIENLEKAIEDLENLSEEEIKNMSNDEFSNKINNVINSISTLDPSTYTTNPEDFDKKVAEIKKEFSDPDLINELNLEDSQIIGNERRAIKANEREKAKYTPGNFKSIADFKINFYKAIKDQVEEIEQQDQSWSVINRRYDGTNRVAKGNKNQNLYNNLIPTIDIYIDCSASWEDADIKIGEDAVSYVLEFENKKQIKTNLYYFSDNIHSSKQLARDEGGTTAWYQILDNIKANKSKNIVLLTDADMNHQARSGPKCIVDGCVWLIWKNGKNSQEIAQHLIGKRGNYQYQFKSIRRRW